MRVDHPDGLARPLGSAGQERLFLRACHTRYQAESRQTADWPTVGRLLRERYRAEMDRDAASPLARRFPIVVEKILTRDEPLPDDWPIDQDRLATSSSSALNGLFVDPQAREVILSAYREEFTGELTKPGGVLFDAKRRAGEPGEQAERWPSASRAGASLARPEEPRLHRVRLGRALGTIMATFPVYRTYLQPGRPISKFDRRTINGPWPRPKNPTIDTHPSSTSLAASSSWSIPATLQDVARRRPSLRFQRATGPVQAKGLEDDLLRPTRSPRSRGRRRPVALRHLPREVPRPERPPPPPLARWAARHRHARHEAGEDTGPG